MAWPQGVLFTLLMTAAAPVGADPQALAAELIRVMRADQLASERAENQLLSRCRHETCDADHRACLKKPHPEDFVERFAPRVERELTPAEIRAAIDYFKSDVGDKHIVVLRGEVGLSRETLFNQRPQDRERMLAWLDTRAGYLLVTRSLLTNDSEVNDWIRRRVTTAWYECRTEAENQRATASAPRKSP